MRALSNGFCALVSNFLIFTFLSSNVKTTVGVNQHLDIAADSEISDSVKVGGLLAAPKEITTGEKTSVQHLNSTKETSRFSRIINPANPLDLFGNPNCEASNYEGTCIEAFRCWVLGGRVGPICKRLRGTCCRFLRHCGQRSSQEVIYFSNNKFDGSIQQPNLGFADLPPECEFEVIKRTEHYCGLRIEPYIDPELINPDSADDGASNDERCTDSVLSIVGLPKRHEFSMCNTRDAYTRKRYEINITDVPNLKLRLSSFSRSGSPVDVKIKQIKCEEFNEEDTSGTVIPGPGPEVGTSGPGGVQPPAPPIPVTAKPPSPPSPPPPGPNYAACGKKGAGRKSRHNRQFVDAEIHEPVGPPVNTFTEFPPDTTGSKGIVDGLLPTWDVPTNNESVFAQLMGKPSLQTTRITNGLDTQPKEFPWQVALLKSDNKFHCGASIIADYYVLTAAHCVINHVSSPQSLILRLGEWSLSSSSGGAYTSAHIAKIQVHPQYSRTNLQNDLAVIKLKNRIEFSDRIRPVCLPTTDIHLAGKIATITGWGRNEFGSLEDKLNQLTAVIIDNNSCSSKWGGSSFIVPSMMCMDSQLGDSCNGDSGGPAVIEYPENSGKYVQVGIVSFGSGSCTDKNLPGVYTRVTYFRDWIFRQMV